MRSLTLVLTLLLASFACRTLATEVVPTKECTQAAPLEGASMDVSHRRFDKTGNYSVVASAEKAVHGWELSSISLMPAEGAEPIHQGEIDGFSSLAVAAKIPIDSMQQLQAKFVYRNTATGCVVTTVRNIALEP